MSNAYLEIAARLRARRERRAVPVRSTSALARRGAPPFGIAPIRVVSEQRAQAIAFGPIGEPPRVVSTWHPLGRDSSWLEPFAQALDLYVTFCLDEGVLPRIWVPHGAALEVVDLLGHRYERNKKASDALRRMGAQCRALGVEYNFSGQQTVVVASELLLTHVVTGMQPTEDKHLGALLAWADPVPSIDPGEEADRRALTPAAAMLVREKDDEVESKRKLAKGKGSRAAESRREIENILAEGALAEWDLLVRARRAFSKLGLAPASDADKLVRLSYERMAIALRMELRQPSKPDSLSRRLDSLEYSIALKEDVDTRSDELLLERARREGRVFFAEVVEVDQPRRSRKPCVLTLHTFQEVLRVRKGGYFQTEDARVIGRVLDVREGGEMGGRFIVLRLTKGFRKSVRPQLGSMSDWMDTVIIDMRFRMKQVYAEMKAKADPLVYGEDLPPAVPRRLPPGNLLDVLEGLKKV